MKTDPRAARIQAILTKKSQQLTRAERAELAALDTDPSRPLVDIPLVYRDGTGTPVTWSVHGLRLLQQIRSASRSQTNALAKLGPQLGGFDPDRTACPGVTEAGLAWLLVPLSPERATPETLAPWPGLEATTDAQRTHRWEAAVAALEALLGGPKPLVGGEAAQGMATWAQDTLMMALAGSHMATVPAPTLLNWFDRLTTACGWETGAIPAASERLLDMDYLNYCLNRRTDHWPVDQRVHLELLVQTWWPDRSRMVHRGPTRLTDQGLNDLKVMTALRHQLAQPGPLRLDDPLKRHLKQSDRPAFRELVAKLQAQDRHAHLVQVPVPVRSRSRPRS